MTELPKQYNPHDHEAGVYKQWEEKNVFAPNKGALKAGKKPFVTMLPPPNITGSLHMGHALQDTIMDILTRWHRMQGEPALWLPGMDHAALPTNKIIVDQLREEGKTPAEIGREEFLKRASEWYEKTGAVILDQMKRLGSSCDWSRARFTMDEKYVQAVLEAFIRYYNKGYIYRGARIVNWDPTTQTTVSDLEIEWQKEKTPLYYLQYGPFEIGTSRPETKFGDKYVVMHPDDSRYARYQHGDTFEAEWFSGKVTATVIKDEGVDPSFGTGVMTITPWHDVADFEIAQRHDLDMEQIIGFDGKLLPIAGEFAGQTIDQSRPRIIEKLREKGLLLRVDEQYEHNVAINDRGKGMIEPQVMRQWFVKMDVLKEKTLKAVDEELLDFVPPRWKKHFVTWMEGVRDWNINRQIWLGHQLPVWWKPGTRGTENEEGNFVVSIEKPSGEWQQDPDVLDTWFSSALWPFATLGWPEQTEDLKTFYPTSVLVTGRDILYLWVVRMVFSGLDLLDSPEYERSTSADRIPFREVMIHPTVLTKTGQRMSKSLGTGIDPLELIEEYGADATRFGLMYQMSYDSQAVKFDEEAIKAARNFANKIWNIGRLLASLEDRDERSVADDWIVQQQARTGQHVTKLLHQYKMGEAARALHDFVWKDFADWYIEIVKVEGSTRASRDVFRHTLQLLHPFMPFITEVLWAHFEGEGLLVVSPWPHLTPKPDKQAEEEMAYIQDVVSTIRSLRTTIGITPGVTVEVYVARKPALARSLERLARVSLRTERHDSMRQFPLSTGEALWVSSEEITEESITAAAEKLEKEARKVRSFIKQQTAILQRMKGKADTEVIQEKEKMIEVHTQRLTEIEKSVTALRQ